MTTPELRRGLRAELKHPQAQLLPASLWQAIEALPDSVSPDLLRDWLTAGLSLVESPYRPDSVAGEFFRAGLSLSSNLDEARFRAWFAGALQLHEVSADVTLAYLRAAPDVISELNAADIAEWATLGRQLCGRQPKSLWLAERFFAATPALLPLLSFDGLRRLGLVLQSIGRHSADHAMLCLEAVAPAAQLLDHDELLAFLDFALAMLAASWMEAVPYFQRAPGLLSHVERFQRIAYLKLLARAAPGLRNASYRWFIAGIEALKDVRTAYHGRLIELASAILPFSSVAALAFLKNTPLLTARLSLEEVEAWHAAGIQTFLETGSGGDAYFRLELHRAQEMLRIVGSRVDLANVVHVLNLYVKALLGAGVMVQPASDLKDKGIGWVGEASASTEGTAIYLPEHVQEFETQPENFEAFKVLATHQAGHIEFGSFGFGFESEAGALPARRREIESQQRNEGLVTKERWLTDMERFFDLFPERDMAKDLFALAEDLRIDSRIYDAYAGLRRTGLRLKEIELKRRPNTYFLAMRQAFVENLLRASLGGEISAGWPEPLLPLLRGAIDLLAPLRDPQATVEDAAETALLLYEAANKVPNLPPGEGGFMDWMSIAELEEENSLKRHEFEGVSGREVPYESVAAIDLYGDFKPEMVQLLMRLRAGEEEESSTHAPLTPDQIRALLEASAEVKVEDETGMETLIGHLQDEAARNEELIADQEAQSLYVKSAPLGTRSYFYNEWDFRAGDYRPRWCTIREHVIAEGSGDFYDRTLVEYADLVSDTQRHFELMKPEPFRKIKRLEDGEDFDLDLAIEFLVQKRAGNGDNQKIFWRRNKVERQVAVAVLLDMSSSTEARIDEKRWPPKRIIDLEKESLVLLTGALEVIGDRYGIFGFSGSGRHNVEYFSIKEFNESFSDVTRRRIDNIEPADSTRMGTAIRHTTSKLMAIEARTRILFVVSDGRPQDVDYGSEPGDREYAIHDTHMALLEAKGHGITPFAVTVDKDGHDYLGQMCGDMAYEVISDIELLPSRLPGLYRLLTE